MNIKLRIIIEIQEFIKKNGREPIEIHLTRVEEWQLLELGINDIAGLATEIITKGPRNAINDAGGIIMGKKVVWDAKEFHVE